MAFKQFDRKDPDDRKSMREFVGPHQLDQYIRMAIQTCWMALPDGKKSVDEVEKQVRRVVDRALRNLREDAESFELGN